MLTYKEGQRTPDIMALICLQIHRQHNYRMSFKKFGARKIKDVVDTQTIKVINRSFRSLLLFAASSKTASTPFCSYWADRLNLFVDAVRHQQPIQQRRVKWQSTQLLRNYFRLESAMTYSTNCQTASTQLNKQLFLDQQHLTTWWWNPKALPAITWNSRVNPRSHNTDGQSPAVCPLMSESLWLAMASLVLSSLLFWAATARSSNRFLLRLHKVLCNLRWGWDEGLTTLS